MHFELPALPYAKDALEPHLGAETLEYHYEKHHRGYLKKLATALAGTPAAEWALDEIVCTATGRIFDNAAQVWNHTFYWRCMRPRGGGTPPDGLRGAIEASFGTLDGFRRAFLKVAKAEFGSGWAWLAQAPGGGGLVVRSTTDARTPLTEGFRPLLTADVWEHAYYLDYRNDRERYVRAFLDHLVNWDFVASRFERTNKGYGGRAPIGDGLREDG